MKNKLLCLGLLLLSLSMITGCNKSKKQEDINQNKIDETDKTEEVISNETVENQGDFSVKDVAINVYGAESIVSGTVKNNSEFQRSVNVILKMSNKEKGQLLGIANVDIDELAPFETREFSLSMVGDYENVDYFDVMIVEK